ncbi:DUF4199 domain-containing protein [Longimicrobium sp.]|uniref:DUF4199 domain-containing protein n=1 Tax=Longimicrobium sp. TaxID=2029185 RepID=UPI002BD93BC7|nr:DUF4199 domain-containing protein [Longimicrobium sp.]HSU14098.1 DUF4199 domain-containing protein [Longimicrobium sp.]
MKKTVWTFGLISGAILSAMMLLTMPFADRIGFDRMEIIGYTTMVLSFLLVFFGIRSYRDNVAGGTVGFGRALAVGALIVLVASLCYVATWELIASRLAPDFLARYQAHEIEQVRASGATPAEVQQKLAELQRFAKLYRNPAINAAMTLLEPLPVGLVMALVSAGILSRRRRSTEEGLAAAVA